MDATEPSRTLDPSVVLSRNVPTGPGARPHVTVLKSCTFSSEPTVPFPMTRYRPGLVIETVPNP
jgi:hypothetical protein